MSCFEATQPDDQMSAPALEQTQETLRIAMSHPAPGKGQGKGQGKGRRGKGWMPRGASLLRHLQGMQPSSIPRLVTWDDDLG